MSAPADERQLELPARLTVCLVPGCPDSQRLHGLCTLHGGLAQLKKWAPRHWSAVDLAELADLTDDSQPGTVYVTDEPQGEARGQGRRMSRTTSRKSLRRLKVLRSDAEALEAENLERERAQVQRPRTRAGCVDGPRPCIFAGCKHHLALEVSPSGSVKLRHHVELTELRETCALDVADRGGATLEVVGLALGITRERARQLEASGLEKLKAAVESEQFTTFTDRHPPDMDGIAKWPRRIRRQRSPPRRRGGSATRPGS